ncbi:hypothetical protein M569_04741, partial [Genlisea aurea]
LIWLCLFIGFAVKTPLYPFHIWLPEAHSEAPTTGSVMLAGVLLKMGTYMMLSHGLISSALFFSIGLLYKIYGTRSLIYYNSLAHFMPRFSMAFFIFTLANMGFPGTAGFPGELLIFTALVGESIFLSVLVGIGSLFTGVYSIWLL